MLSLKVDIFAAYLFSHLESISNKNTMNELCESVYWIRLSDANFLEFFLVLALVNPMAFFIDCKLLWNTCCDSIMSSVFKMEKREVNCQIRHARQSVSWDKNFVSCIFLNFILLNEWLVVVEVNIAPKEKKTKISLLDLSGVYTRVGWFRSNYVVNKFWKINFHQLNTKYVCNCVWKFSFLFKTFRKKMISLIRCCSEPD